MQKTLEKLLCQILEIPSPTYQETTLRDWFQKRLAAVSNTHFVKSQHDGLIQTFSTNKDLPHIALVGHLDVVPEHFTPRIENGSVYGSGASDMQAALACFLYLIENNLDEILTQVQLSLILYSREEGTAITDNGLYDLIQDNSEFFESIDLAIVGEPTNMTLQLGCVGSLHTTITVPGKQAHSARPWDGENALYKAAPLINHLTTIKPIAQSISNVTYYDVMSITESGSQPGRTTVPGEWTCNINYRFSPVHRLATAEKYLIDVVTGLEIPGLTYEITDRSPAGNIIDSPIMTQARQALNLPVEAKQAWTDVAQLSEKGIPCFNFGPGLTAQAHTPDERVPCENLSNYTNKLGQLLTHGGLSK